MDERKGKKKGFPPAPTEWQAGRGLLRRFRLFSTPPLRQGPGTVKGEGIMPLRRAIYPGSFDPVTVGHLDIIRRAASLFDTLIVAVAHNEAKNPLFDVETRLAMLHSAVGDLSGVVIRDLDGLLVDFAREEEAFVVIRGLRAVSDFEFEFQMALMNRRLEERLETIFLAPRQDCTFLSSRIVKEIARFGGDVSSFVTDEVARQLKEKFSSS